MEENNNPFKKGSTQYRDFELMKDCEWHCSKCELKSGQAKTWQVWRQEKGILVLPPKIVPSGMLVNI